MPNQLLDVLLHTIEMSGLSDDMTGAYKLIASVLIVPTVQ
jgi:hypothetical protein